MGLGYTTMYKVHTEPSTLPEFINNFPTFADIESDGLYIKPRIIQIYQPQTSDLVHIIDLTYFSLVEANKLLTKLWLVFYKASYDLGTLNIVPQRVDDMFYATKMAFPEFQNYGLDDVCDLLRYDNYKDIDKAAMQKSKWVLGSYLSSAQLTYAATDCLVLERLWEEPKIQHVVKTNKAYFVDILSLRYTLEWQENGMPVIPENYAKAVNSTNEDIAKYTALLPKLVNGNTINPRSSQQVCAYLGTDKSDKPTLVRFMVSGHPKSSDAEIILNARKALNDKSKLDNYNFPYVKGRFDPYGTITGRYNCVGGDLPNGINMQNYPRQFKGVFGAVAEDEVIIGADYSTLELRLACMIYNEPNMYKALMEGVDIHTQTASLLTGKPLDQVTPEERQNAKPVNFGFTFGLSAVNFIEYAFDLYGLKFTLAQSTEFREKFFKAYPSFRRYHEFVYTSMRTKLYVCSTALGRQIKPARGTDAINAPVQGSGGETTKLAVHYMVQENPEATKVIMNVIHDAIYLRVKKVNSEYWADVLERNMLKGWEQISKSSLFSYHDIPMTVGLKIGKTVKDV